MNSNSNKKHWMLGGVTGLVAVAVLAGATACRSQNTHPEPAAPGSTKQVALAPASVPSGTFGVVDYKKLLGAHKDYKNLTILDGEIDRLEQSLSLPPATDPKLQQKVKKQLTDLQETFHQRFLAEQNAAMEDLRRKQEAASGELQSLAGQMQQDLKSQIDSLPKGPAQPQLPANFQSRKTEIEGQMRSYLSDLSLIRQRQLAARRIELQRQADQRLAARKAAMDRELSAYEAQLESESQQQKVNLELQKISAKTDEDRQKIDDQLSNIKTSQEQKRQARRDQLTAQFQQEEKTALAQVDAQVKAYQSRIDQDAQAKVAQEQQRLVHQYFPNAGRPQPVGPPPQIAQKINAIKAQQSAMKSQFDARKAALTGQLAAERDQMAAHLKQRYAEMKQEFDRQAQAIIRDAQKMASAGTKEDMAKRENIKKELADLQAQRKRLFDRMVDDLRAQVDVVARKAGVSVVLGEYVWNNNCKDLTADVLQAMGQ